MRGTLIKYKNTGSQDPFNARMMYGILTLRDAIITSDEERLEFDTLYSPILENLEDCLESKIKLDELIKDHEEAIKKGEIVSFQQNGQILEIKKSISRELNMYFKDFFIKGQIAIGLLPKLTCHYDMDIKFFLSKQNKFNTEVEKFSNISSLHFELAKMLKDDKEWHNLFSYIRGEIEHAGFKVGEVNYRVIENNVKPLFPRVNNIRIDEAIEIMWNNVFEFVEDVIVFMIKNKLKYPFEIYTIPEDKRDNSLPVKYVISLSKLIKLPELK